MVQAKYQGHFVWKNIIIISSAHIFAAVGLWYLITGTAKWQSALFLVLYIFFGAFGTTAGSHRLWTHRAYKAKLPLRILLCIQQTSTMQTPILDWVRDHRVHHKYSDTDADPHNASRGFFFSHMGWLMVRKNAQVKEKGRQLDLSDMLNDKVVMFQKKYYPWLAVPLTVILPTFIPWYYWNEDLFVSWSVAFNLRYAILLNMAWSVNSVAHIWGNKPYDKDILPAENLGVALFAFGEGWHNYHHVFPWDYKTAELGPYSTNWTTGFIDFMSKIGWAYDLKSVSDDVIKARVLRTGDGSKVVETKTKVLPEKLELEKNVWGFGDHEMPPEMEKYIVQYNS